MPRYLISKKVVFEARIRLPRPEAEMIAKIKMAQTCPSTPESAFLRPKLIPLAAANTTEGPTLIDAMIEMLR